MFIQHKVAKGESYQDILKKYGVKDGKALWALKDNKAIRSKRKTPDKLAPGDKIWVPDKNSKVYTFQYGGRTQVFSEKEWKDFNGEIVKKLKEKVLKPAKAELKFQDQQYQSMIDMQNDHPIASWIIEVVAWTDLSDKQKKAAKKAVDAFEAAVNSGNFKKIQSLMTNMEKALVAYAKEVNGYVDDIIGGADKAIWATQLTRDASFVIAASIAVTVVAPAGATVGVMAKTGFMVGGAAGFTKSVASEVGESLAGNERSIGTITWNIAKGTFAGSLMGALGGAAGKLICGKVAAPLAQRFLSGPTMSNLATRLVSSQTGMVDKLLGGAITRIGAEKGTAFATEMAATTLAKVMLRVPIGTVIKTCQDLLFSDQPLLKKTVDLAMKKSSGKENPDQFAEKMMPYVSSDKFYDKLMAELLKKYGNAYKKEMEKAEKKMK